MIGCLLGPSLALVPGFGPGLVAGPDLVSVPGCCSGFIAGPSFGPIASPSLGSGLVKDLVFVFKVGLELVAL